VIAFRDVTKEFTIPHLRRGTVFQRLFAAGRYSYETFPALRSISFQVTAGEFVGVLGRNGSGKSTLLRLAAGIYHPTRGSVRVDGSVAPVLDLGVGFNAGLPVRDNVLLYGVLLGIPRRRLLEELPGILERAGVTRFADARLEALSTGLRMRLAFTVALLAEAPVALIDEALSVGDEEFQDRSIVELQALRARGLTALLVTHSTELLRRLCDRVLVLRDGEIRGHGPVGAMIDLYHSP
jgi:lipopolysaccharide transport system ATP-binding protein